MTNVYATYNARDLVMTREALLGSITRARTCEARRIKPKHSVSSLTKSYNAVVAEMNARGIA